MKDMSWINNPAFININAIKREIIMNLVTEAAGKSMQQSLPLLMKASSQLKEHNMSFTQDENNVIMGLLTKDMSSAEKAKLESMQQMINKMKPMM